MKARPRGSRRRSSDSGFSFVEVLVSVVILGLAGVAVLGAAAAAARGSSVQRSHSNAQSVIAAAADEIMGMSPVVCPAARSTYQVAARARVDSLQLGAGWTGATVTVGPVREWDAAANQFQPYADAVDPEASPLSACDTDAPELLTPHLVPLTVTSPNGHAIKRVEVVTSAIPDRVPIGNPLVFGESPFAVLTFGDLRMEGQLHVYGGAAVGGNLSFDGNQAALGKTSPGVFVSGADGAPASLIVQGHVNYLGSTGTLNVERGWIHVGDMSTGEYATESSKLVLRSVPASAPRIEFAPGITQANHPETIDKADIFDFEAAQRVFIAESLALSQLPGQCADAASARLIDAHGRPATSTGNARWELVPNRVNTLTTTLDQLPTGQVSKANLTEAEKRETPLIVNVMDEGEITFSQGAVTNGMESHTIWNFPNATELTIVSNQVAGSVLAPTALVDIDSDVNGALISESLTGGYAVKWAMSGNTPNIRDVLCDRGI